MHEVMNINMLLVLALWSTLCYGEVVIVMWVTLPIFGASLVKSWRGFLG
jgi:hypothetical protein